VERPVFAQLQVCICDCVLIGCLILGGECGVQLGQYRLRIVNDRSKVTQYDHLKVTPHLCNIASRRAAHI